MIPRKVYHRASPLVQKLNIHSGNRSFAFIYITNECQLNCAHCSFQSGSSKPFTRLDENIILGVLDELRGIKDITLTGGEPLLHPGFRMILGKAAENAGIVYVMTNGIKLVGKEKLRDLDRRKDKAELIRILKTSLKSFPENTYLFFPLDSFHLKTFKPFGFLLQGLSDLAGEWNWISKRPYLAFLSNEVSREKSQELIDQFKVQAYSHIGTALFAPWRKYHNEKEWYNIHTLNRQPFAGGIYINYKGVYLNEASLLMDLRKGIVTDLKLGKLKSGTGKKNQLEILYGSVNLNRWF